MKNFFDSTDDEDNRESEQFVDEETLSAAIASEVSFSTRGFLLNRSLGSRTYCFPLELLTNRSDHVAMFRMNAANVTKSFTVQIQY